MFTSASRGFFGQGPRAGLGRGRGAAPAGSRKTRFAPRVRQNNEMDARIDVMGRTPRLRGRGPTTWVIVKSTPRVGKPRAWGSDWGGTGEGPNIFARSIRNGAPEVPYVHGAGTSRLGRRIVR